MYHVQYSDYAASFFFSVQSAGWSSRDLIYIDIDLYRDKHVLLAPAYRKSYNQRNFLDDKSTSMLERPMSFYNSQKITYKYLKNSMQNPMARFPKNIILKIGKEWILFVKFAQI